MHNLIFQDVGKTYLETALIELRRLNYFDEKHTFIGKVLYFFCSNSYNYNCCLNLDT